MIRPALVAVALLAALPAQADDQRRDLAERAVLALYEEQVAERLMEVFWPVAAEAIRARVPGINDMRLFQYRSKTEAFAAEAAHAGLEPLVEMFARGFTATELADLAAFYESSVGQKFNRAQARIGGVLTGAAGEALTAELETLRGRVDAMLEADGF